MGFRRLVLSWALGAWLPSLCMPVSAQMQPGQWVGEHYIVKLCSEEAPTTWLFVDEKDYVCDAIPNVRDAADALGLCQSCVVSWDARWHGDALYTLADGGQDVDEGGVKSRRHVLAKWEEGRWQRLGDIKTGTQGIMVAIPCDNGRFVVISSHVGMFGDEGSDPTPFRAVSLPQAGTEFRLDRSIDHGQDALRGRMSAPSCFWFAIDSSIIMTEGRATLVNHNTGLYWVFSMETASLVKAGSIFKDMTPERMANGGIDRAVLCVNPEKTGTVLLSAQDEGLLLAEKVDAYREYSELYDKVPLDQTFGQNIDWIEELYRRRLQEVKARSPLIVWYRIHPENGRLERLPAPPEGGSSIREVQDKDHWRPMPDGSVKMGWDPQHIDKIKTRASEWADGRRDGGATKEAEGAGPSPADEDKAKGDAPPEGNVADGGADKDKTADKTSASLRG